MSENGVMDRPRRTTRSSLASSNATNPQTPSTSNNPYKKPTYFSNSRQSTGGDTPTSSRNTNGTPSSGRGRRGRGRPPGARGGSGTRGSGSTRGSHHQQHHHHTKPECIAVRLDGRRSTGGSTASSGGGRRGAAHSGRRSTYNSRHDYEYHYGSDFESDQNESDGDEDEIDSEPESDDGDSVSIGGAREENAESDSDFSVSSTKVTSSRLPSPPVPIWLDTEKVPETPLDLPNSSEDLLLSREHVVKAVEIYEPLRRFHQLVRLTPFRFEDFCGALATEDQSSLLAEIHIQLLKCIIREEDSNGTLFGPTEVKDSVQTVVYFIDHITWPESLRSYLESDSTWKDVYDALASVEYPFCGPAIRIKILGWLVDQFLTTSVVREQLLGDGTILHEDHCRSCNRLGELICCESCPAVYHLQCISPPLKDMANPPDDWKCSICTKHQIPGVNDCTSEVEKMGLLIRHERLGYDRHGRKYWFLVRRLLAESEDGSEVWYYSTRGQVEELLQRLDSDNYESILAANIRGIEEEIYRQMEVTEEVTRLQNTQRRKTYLELENGDKEGGEQERMTRLKSTGLYKLGQEGLYRTYVNHFSTDPSAYSKTKHNEERDRKRHMSHKFSLTTASECKWGVKDFNGSRATQIAAIRAALSHMEAVLPTTLMHVNWPMLRKSWISSVHSGASAVEFSKAMIMISACIRNVVYNPVWSESTGHVRLIRMSLLERDERKKAEKRDKKDRDDEEDRLKLLPQFIKYPIPMKHQVYKQKGEEYRIHGRWGWIWLSNLRRCKSQDCREKGLLSGPHKHVIQVKNETGKVKTMLIDPGVYSKLMAKRNLATTVKQPPTVAETTSPIKDGDLNSASSSSDTTSTSNDRENVQTTEELSKDKLNNSDEDEQVKIEGSEQDNGLVGTEQSKPTPVENDLHEEESEKVEPKVEPENMEVDTVDEHLQNGNLLDKDKKNEKQVGKKDDNTEHVKVDSKIEVMDVDESEAGVKSSSEDNDKSSEADAVMNGNLEKGVIKEAEKMNEKSSLVHENKEENKNNEAMEEEAPGTVESQDQEASSTSAVVPPPNPPLTPDASKSDDSQGRKFKTELVNVSSGLASAHRILYPKVARRSDLLDGLLQRRLTLMSLEEKQLKSAYGEDMVARAKSGLVTFEEEEKKREREAEEYPCDEVIDDNLTLAGAYAFKCYSSECRNEAILFMKTKGKNRDRIYEKICYSPMCRLKFCLQETTRFKQERLREVEREKYYKVYKEIEEKRAYTVEETSSKVYMKKLPDCVTATNGAVVGAGTAAASSGKKKTSKLPDTKYPQTSSFQYATSREPSILVLAQYELKRLARTAGRHFTPCGFFPNQKSGSWGWSYPCGRPVFRTAWQYKISNANTLAAAAMQLRILYASIRWDDILAKIPNTEGKHQIQTDTEIITSEILNHRIVGRFIERVQYLRKMMVVPIDAPKTIREITPSRIGLRKRKRAESPDKTEPVVTEDWVDEERLELWEIRYYGDRIDRKHDRKSESNTPSTRTKSGIAIKQPEKYDPSPTAPIASSVPAASAGDKKPVIESSSVDKTIENVIRETKLEKPESSKTVSAVKTAELMRETIETEMKMQRAVHLSKRDNHAKHNNNNSPSNTKAPSASKQQTASQQLQQQKAGLPSNSRSIAQVAVSTPTSSKIGAAVVGKKFFINKQTVSGAVTSGGTPTSTTTAGLDSQGLAAGILSRKPAQSTITINKGIGGSISVVKTPVQSTVPPVAGPSTTTPVATSNVGANQQASPLSTFGPPQKLSVIRLPDGRLQVRGLLPGQHCYQTADGKIHVTVAAPQLQQIQSPKVQVTTAPAAAVTPTTVQQQQQQQPSVIMQGGSSSSSGAMIATQSQQQQQQQVSNSPSVISNTAITPSGAQVQTPTQVQQQQQQPMPAQQLTQQVVSSQPLINISNPVMKTAISTTTPVVTAAPAAASKPVQQQPQQIIVQQQGGQHVIIHGSSAQALLQQQQKIQRIVQASTPTQVVKQIGATTTVNAGRAVVSATATTANQITSTTASSSSNAGHLTVSGRIVMQDGKALIISSPSGGSGHQVSDQMLQQQRKVIQVNKQAIQAGVQGQGTIVRPQQVIQTNSQGQLIQGQPLQIIQGVGGQQLHLFTQGGQTQQIVIQQQQKVSEPGKLEAAVSTVGSTTTASSSLTVPSTSASIIQSAGPSSPSKVSIATAAQQTALKHVLGDGRTVLLSPQQLSDLTSGSGGRKVILNKQLVHTGSGGVGLSTGQPTIQILQGPGGQQFLIQQPSQTLIQQTQQQTQPQQVQIIVPSGQQLGGQQFLVKKFLKTSTTTSTTTSVTSSQLNKASNAPGNSGVVQIAATAQNQLTQLLGTNKTLVRLENNQIAAIQLPMSATSTASSNAMSMSPLLSKSSTISTTSPVTISSSGHTNHPQSTTTITRTPGLPISIVSPSKNKVIQQQQQQKPGSIQVISTAPSSSLSSTPFSNSIISTSSVSTVPTSSVVHMSTTPNKSHTVVRLASPGGVVKSGAGLPIVTSTPVHAPSPRTIMNQTTHLRQPQPSVSVSPQKLVTLSSPAKQPIQLPTPPPAPSNFTQQISQSLKSVPTTTQTIVNTVTQSSFSGLTTAQVVATKSQPVVAVLPSSSPVKIVPPPDEVTQQPLRTTAGAQAQTINPTTAATSGINTSISSPKVSVVTPPVSNLSTIASTSTTTPTVSAAVPAPSTKLPGKSAPSKIVAQIFQTAQGPKVVIQGVSPGDLTQAQMSQLQAQIQKQLAAQQPTPKATTPTIKQETTKPNSVVTPPPPPPQADIDNSNIKNRGASPVSVPVHSVESAASSQYTQNSISTPPQPVPTALLPPPPSAANMPGNGVQMTSPQVLRSVASDILSPLQSPPHNVISPASLPSLASPPLSNASASKSVVGKRDLVAAVSSVTEPAFPVNPALSPARSPPPPPPFNSISVVQNQTSKGKMSSSSLSSGPSQIVAKKSAPRKSPLKSTVDPSLVSYPVNDVNVLDGTNNTNSIGRSFITAEQQQSLTEHSNSLREDIMEKKKAAATQMKLEAQREIQEKLAAAEAAKMLEEQKRATNTVPVTHHSPLDPSHARGAKKRKSKEMENMESNSRTPGSMPPSSRREPKGSSKRKRKLFCVCKTPYDKDKFYVGCDKCENWFHGDCIGITEEMSKDLPEYICDDCRDDKLYCFCRKPYNESQFYIQCDKCEEWFHGRCVGVAQGESDMIGDYSCPTCEPNSEINFPNSKRLDSTDYSCISRLVKEMFQNRSSMPFRKPVTKAQAPNYFAIIKEPMDLQTINIRVEDRQYEKLLDFIGDVTKIFENCRYFNDSSSDIYRHADNLERFFVQKIWTLRQGFNTRLHQVIP